MPKRNEKTKARQEKTPGNPEPAGRGGLTFGLAIFLVAAVIRLIYGIELWRHPEYAWPVIDAASYHNFAATWIESGLRDSTTAWHAAFYPLFLALVYSLFGVSVYGAMVVQLALGSLTCAGIGLLARRLFGNGAGWFSGLFAAIYGPLVFYEAALMSAGWSVTWSLLMCWNVCRPMPRNALVRGAIIGVLAAGAALIRPELIAGYAGALLVRLKGVSFRDSAARIAAGRTAAATIMMFYAIVLPVGWMNKSFTDRLSWLPVNGGLNVYIANSGDLCATLGARPGPDYDRIVNLPKQAGLQNLEEQNQFFYRTTFERMVNEPLSIIRGLFWKAVVLLSSREISLDLDGYAVHDYSSLLPLLQWKAGNFGFPFGILLPGALLIFWRRDRRELSPLLGLVLISALALIALSPASRYRLILIPPLLILAGGGLMAGISWWHENRRRWPVLLMIGVTAVLQSWPGPFCLESFDFKAERYRMIGQRVQDPVLARPWLERARSRDDSDPQTYFFLAMNSWSGGSLEQALREINQALVIAPDFNLGLMLKSDILSEMDAHAAAREALQSALAANPALTDAGIRLAASFARDGLFAEAIQAIDQALIVAPHHNGALATAASIKIDAGQPRTALNILQELLKEFPDDADLRLHAAIAARALNDESMARHHLIEALRVRPDDQRARALLETGGDIE